MGFTEAYYEFFIELTTNNQKSWFDENRARYERDVKSLFSDFVTSVLGKMSALDSRFEGLDAKQCIFRINKDVRFSKDKAPYKLHCAAAMQIGGRKEMGAGGLYIQMGPEHCGVYSGVYMPEKEELMRIRGLIAGDLEGFDRVIKEKSFVKYYGEVRGEKNKRIDSNWMDAAAKQPLIYNKQFYVEHEIDAEDTLRSDFDDYLVEAWKASRGFNDFLQNPMKGAL
jgi:uncharacterized protein (TIGR02453 family)